jgi:hypothetical protein
MPGLMSPTCTVNAGRAIDAFDQPPQAIKIAGQVIRRITQRSKAEPRGYGHPLRYCPKTQSV